MEPQEKICSVVKDILDKSEISPDPSTVIFEFSDGIIGGGMDSDDERKILAKLDKERVIQIIYAGMSYLPNEVLNCFGKDKLPLLEKHPRAKLKLINNSIQEYYTKKCRKILPDHQKKSEKTWVYYTNPFWLLLSLFHLIRRFKLISVLILLLTVIAFDYELVLDNLNWLIERLSFIY